MSALGPEDKALIIDALRRVGGVAGTVREDRRRALAARLEATDGQEGFVLTPEEVDFVLGWKAFCEISDPAPGFTPAERDLAARMEAWETENDPHTEREGNARQG